MRQTWQNGIDKLQQANPDITKAADGSAREIVTLNGGFSDLAELKERRRSKGLQEESWADAVMAAQAWHWAHPKYEEAVVSPTTLEEAPTNPDWFAAARNCHNSQTRWQTGLHLEQ